MLDAPETWLDAGARLGAAAALGALMGWDRQVKGRAAGMRTHMLVALGAAAFIVTAMEIFAESATETGQVQFDPGRVIQGIAGGVGFLGAGAIIQSGGRVRGLTTAAGLWACAAMGLAAGAALYRTALLITVFSMVILIVMRWVEPVGPGENGVADHPSPDGGGGDRERRVKPPVTGA